MTVGFTFSHVSVSTRMSGSYLIRWAATACFVALPRKDRMFHVWTERTGRSDGVSSVELDSVALLALT